MQIDINDIAQHYKNVLCKSHYFNSSKPLTQSAKINPGILITVILKKKIFK